MVLSGDSNIVVYDNLFWQETFLLFADKPAVDHQEAESDILGEQELTPGL